MSPVPHRDREGAALLPWLIVSVVLLALTAATVWYPAVRTFARFEINYNEGWNAYRAQAAANHIPLYGAPPRFTVTNYPPLSFHFIGLLGRLSGDFVAAGRYVSLLSVALIGILIAAIVQRFGQPLERTWAPGVYAGLSFVIWLAIFSPDRIGMNDPQLFATVFSLLGVFAYVAYVIAPESPALLTASALTFAVSLFIKHNLLAFPIAVGAHLLFTAAFRRLAVWLGVFTTACAVLLLLTIRVDGPYFAAHLTAPRPYSIHDAISIIHTYLRAFLIPLSAALAWSGWVLWTPPRSLRGLLVAALAVAHAVAFGFSGGFGVDRNIFFDGMIVVVMILGVTAADLAEPLRKRRFGAVVFTVLLLLPLAPLALVLPGRIERDYQDFLAIPAMEDQFDQAVAFLAAEPGPALCNNLLLCFDAGKPEEFTTYFVSCRLGLGNLSEAELTSLVASGRFNAIQLNATSSGVFSPERFMEGFTRQVLRSYRMGLQTGAYGILIPGASAPPSP